MMGTTIRPKKRSLTVYVPDDVVRRLKDYAYDEGRTMSWIVEQAIREHLTRKGCKINVLEKK